MTLPTRTRIPAPRALLIIGMLCATSSALAGDPAIQSDTGTGADAPPHAVADRMLQALAETSGVPGLGAAVWREGRIVWTGSAGHRDLDAGLPVDRDTVFRLASVSKLITATAAARLREQGRLDVDAPVSSVFADAPASWAGMTPRHLAAHLSGLPHYQDVDVDRGKIRYPDVDAAVGIFRDRTLLSAPGTRYEYSSWGYTLLSALVARTAGKPFLDVVREDVAPGLVLGPDATDSGDPAASRAYEFVDGRIRRAAPHDFSYTWAGGGLGATPQALATFGGRLLQGHPVERATFEWMLEPTIDAQGAPARDDDATVGFGWRLERDRDGARIAHHAGVTIGARSALVVWPDDEASASLLSNTLWVASIEQSAITLAAPFRAAPAGLVARDCPLRATRYEGRHGEDAITGEARFRIEDGLCTGELVADATLHAKWDRFPQRDADRLRIIGLDPDGGLARAGLATPIGLYDLRATADGDHTATLGPRTTLTLRFR